MWPIRKYPGQEEQVVPNARARTHARTHVGTSYARANVRMHAWLRFSRRRHWQHRKSRSYLNAWMAEEVKWVRLYAYTTVRSPGMKGRWCRHPPRWIYTPVCINLYIARVFFFRNRQNIVYLALEHRGKHTKPPFLWFFNNETWTNFDTRNVCIHPAQWGVGISLF